MADTYWGSITDPRVKYRIARMVIRTEGILE